MQSILFWKMWELSVVYSSQIRIDTLKYIGWWNTGGSESQQVKQEWVSVQV